LGGGQQRAAQVAPVAAVQLDEDAVTTVHIPLGSTAERPASLHADLR